MLSDPFMPVFGLLCLLIFVAFWLWQTRGLVTGRITPSELQGYLKKVETAALPAEERADMIERLREWAAADDGKPVYMLNLMRYHDELRRYPGAPDFAGTPQQSNAHYESQVLPLALRIGAYPLTAGCAQGRNTLIIGGKTRRHDLRAAAQELDEWSRVLVMRYPNRRAFFKLVTHPHYLPYMPYKLMALQVALVPVSTEFAIPELRWLAGGTLLVLILGIGWLRAALA